jgi:VWFA-related protein
MTRAAWHGTVCAAIAAGALLSAQQPTFRTRVETVRLDVVVTVEGRPVAGLGLPDFEVRDNGVRQRVREVLGEEVPLDAYFVLDASSSVEGERLANLRRAARAFLAGLVSGDRAALIAFSHQVAAPQALTADLSLVGQTIDAIEPDGATALNDAVYAPLVLREPGERRAVAVVFSDGLENMSWLQDDEVVEAARRADVLVHGITLTPDRPAGWSTLTSGQAKPTLPHENELLRRVAAVTGGRLWHASSSAQLEEVFVGVLREIRSRYILAYDPEPAGRLGWHDVQVRVKGRGRHVSMRPGYLAR